MRRSILAAALLAGCVVPAGCAATPELPQETVAHRSYRARTVNVRQPFDFAALPAANDADAASGKRTLSVVSKLETEQKGHVTSSAELVECGIGKVFGKLQVGLLECWTGEERETRNPCDLRVQDLSARGVGIDLESWGRDSLTELELEGKIATRTCTGEGAITRQTKAQSILGGLVYAYRREARSRRPQGLVLLMPTIQWVVADAEPSSDIVIERGPLTRVELPVQKATSTSLQVSVPIRVVREWLARSGRVFRYPSNAPDVAVDISVELTWGHDEETPLAMATATLVDDGRRVDALRWVEDR